MLFFVTIFVSPVHRSVIGVRPDDTVVTIGMSYSKKLVCLGFVFDWLTPRLHTFTRLGVTGDRLIYQALRRTRGVGSL